MKIVGDLGCSKRNAATCAAGLLFAVVLLVASPADACRGVRNWPSEPNDPRIVRGMIKVIATIKSEFVSQEELKQSIMGPKLSVIYGIEVTAAFGDTKLMGRQMLV